MSGYIDPVSGKTYPFLPPRWASDEGRPLAIAPLTGLGRDDIARETRSLWRYAAALPFPIADPVTLGEGVTPLLARAWRGAKALFKLEWFSATGSFKDRGASVMISALRELGVTRVLEDSSGNGGAAIAAYAAAAGMRAKILVPAYTPAAKTVQMRAYGAQIELVPGTRQDTADEARRQSANIFYASHNWQPLFLQGTKTLAYELWEDLGFRAPDHVVVPCGAGSNVLGCDIGFDELERRGEIARRPRLHAIQPEACAPIARAFAAGVNVCPEIAPEPTIAEGTAIAKPVRGAEVLAAIRRCGGTALAVSESAIEAACRELASCGLYAEPTSAVAAAGLSRLLSEGRIAGGEVAVVVLTGGGLKATQRWSEWLGV
ncbi:MAG: pyridoxal-phosphate dependent enzyme [Roseiarcus sp.]